MKGFRASRRVGTRTSDPLINPDRSSRCIGITSLASSSTVLISRIIRSMTSLLLLFLIALSNRMLDRDQNL